MNERIRELVKQAGGIYHNDDGDELTPALVGKGLEKFAELIVQECVTICNDTNDASYLNGVIAGRKIKEHFGVEE